MRIVISVSQMAGEYDPRDSGDGGSDGMVVYIFFFNLPRVRERNA